MPWWGWLLVVVAALMLVTIILLLLRKPRPSPLDYMPWALGPPYPFPGLPPKYYDSFTEAIRVAGPMSPGARYVLWGAALDAAIYFRDADPLAVRESLRSIAVSAREEQQSKTGDISVRSIFGAIVKKWCRIPPFCGPGHE